MRVVRVFFIASVASCADLSGLSKLGVDASPDDAAIDVAANDAAVVESSTADAPFDAGTTFCTIEAGPAQFCADFDENDVMFAFVNGGPGSWSPLSNGAKAPSLDTDAAVSLPASALFQDESLNYVMPVATPAAITLTMSVRVLATSTAHATPVLIQLDDTHNVTLTLVQSGVSSFTSEVDDNVIEADGGISTTPHQIPVSVSLGMWNWFSLQVTASQIILGSQFSQPLSFTRGVTPKFAQPALVIGFGSDWHGEIDNVTLLTKN